MKNEYISRIKINSMNQIQKNKFCKELFLKKKFYKNKKNKYLEFYLFISLTFKTNVILSLYWKHINNHWYYYNF